MLKGISDEDLTGLGVLIGDGIKRCVSSFACCDKILGKNRLKEEELIFADSFLMMGRRGIRHGGQMVTLCPQGESWATAVQGLHAIPPFHSLLDPSP